MDNLDHSGIRYRNGIPVGYISPKNVIIEEKYQKLVEQNPELLEPKKEYIEPKRKNYHSSRLG